jgi:hypothetical protein
VNLPGEPIQCLQAGGCEIHHIGSLAGLTAKPLAKEVSDIRLIVHLTLMMLPRPLSPGKHAVAGW